MPDRVSEAHIYKTDNIKALRQLFFMWLMNNLIIYNVLTTICHLEINGVDLNTVRVLVRV